LNRQKLANRGVAQLGSALAWGARGRRFKSYRPDQLDQRLRLTLRSWPFLFLAQGQVGDRYAKQQKDVKPLA
jgi:hypothetical protein